MANSSNSSSCCSDLKTQIKQILDTEIGNSGLASADGAKKAIYATSDTIASNIFDISNFKL